MGSSEDYLDSLLKSMGVPEELASPTKKNKEKAAEESSKEEASVSDVSIDVNEVSENLPASKVFVDAGEAEEPENIEEIEEPVSENIVIPEEEFVIPEDTSSDISEVIPDLTEEIQDESESGESFEFPDDSLVIPDESPIKENFSDILRDHSADIPDLDQIISEDPAASDVHIDSAPSLDINDNGNGEEEDLSALMNDLMSRIDTEDTANTKAASSISDLSDLALNEEITDSGFPSDEDILAVSEETSESSEPVIMSADEIMNAVSTGDMTMDEAAEYIKEHDIEIPEELFSEEESVQESVPEMPPIPLVDEYKASVNIDSLSPDDILGENSSESDLDAQLAALLSESGITLDDEEGLKIDTSSKPSDSVIDLDNFMNEMNGVSPEEAPSEKEEAPESASESDASDFDLDAELAELMKEENESQDLPGEDDIEAMLSKAKSEGLADDPDRMDMSLDELLAADSGSASDIGDMLSKNDNNEAVDPGIEALLNGSDKSAPDIFNDDWSPEGAAAEDPAAAKKRLKEEKKEARRKAKEEKARAKKEAREARKNKKKAGASVGEENAASSENVGNADMSDVDALLAGAAEAAAEVKANANALSSEAVPIPREARENLEAETQAEPEENNTLDEADSLLAEIMGNPFGDPDFGESEPAAEESAPAEEPQALSQDELDSILEKENSEKNKKKGLFARLLGMLTETDEDDEDSEKSSIKLSDENAEVLEQLDAEGEDSKGKKKKKKKGEAPEADVEGAGEEVEVGEKKEKKKKKEKKPKEPKEDEKPSKKLNKKKVIAVFGLCFTILVAVLIISRLMGSYTIKREAREAYSEGDYQTAYQDLFGQDLNESDEIIFKKSECILRIRLWLREYEILKDESDVKALDSLIQTVSRYPGLYQSAVKWNCLEDVEPIYMQMVDALYNEYGLTEEQAKEIAMIKKDVDYTRAVYDVVAGLHGQTAPAAPEEPLDAPEPVIEDVIPGESDPGSDIIFVNP